MTSDLPEASKEAPVQQIALGRLGEPSDIAQAVAFLAGPAASYITGETLHVNGGMYMPCRPRPAARPASQRDSRKHRAQAQNGRASGRTRVWQDVLIPVVGVPLKKKK